MNHPRDNTKTNNNGAVLMDLALHDLANLGIGEWAYVKHVEVEGKPAFAVHGADGRPLAVTTDREVAFTVTRQNDLEPLSVH